MFRVSARTILELGSELISSDIIALYELIKNGFDAGSTTGVEIRFNMILRRNAYLTLSAQIDRGSQTLDALRREIQRAIISTAPPLLRQNAELALQKSTSTSSLRLALTQIYLLNTIVVSDTGSGMSIEELNKNFLVIGTPSRKKAVDQALQNSDDKAPFLGEKGIGRLSAMRLGNRLIVATARKQDSKLNTLEIDWAAFAPLDAMLEDIDVSPREGGTKPDPNWSGTTLIICNLAEDWTAERVRDLVDRDFARLTDPFLDQKSRPRVVVFWNEDRLSVPWMEQSLLEHAHARVTGSYDIVQEKPQLTCTIEALDLGFPHPKETERIIVKAHDLEGAIIGASQSQNIHDDALTTAGPFKFEVHWYNRRRLSKIDGIGEVRIVRDLQKKWSGILLFRDGFRVFPYGEDEDDWLGLDRRALGRAGYALNKAQFIGRVTISRTANPQLLDQTNREGLRVTPEQQVLVGVLQHVINSFLFNFLHDVEKQYKQQKIDLADAKTEISSLETRAKMALSRLKKAAPKDAQETVEDLNQAMLEFSEFAERARLRIAEVEEESQQMIEMAGVGLMIEVVAHELARVSENALETLERLQKKSVPEEVRRALESLRAEMKSLSKRVRILDPMSVAGRQRMEIFSIEALLRETFEAHEAQFKRHNIRVEVIFPKFPVHVKAVKGMIVQIIENLISNSKYWMQMRFERESGFQPTIKIEVHDGPPTIIYEDNGRGISPENRERVFKAFFSLKEKTKRRGLGLFIARECAQYHGGTLILEETRNPETGRLHRFTLELPTTASVQ